MRKNAAIGIIFNHSKSQILLVKRQDVPVWVLPGGGIEDNESSETAVKREVLEETGLKVGITRKVAEYSALNKLARFTETYECYPIEGVLQKGSETHSVQFFPIDQLPKNLFFLHQTWLNDCLKNQSDLIQKPLTDVTYWNFIKYFLKHPFWVLRFLITLFRKD